MRNTNLFIGFTYINYFAILSLHIVLFFPWYGISQELIATPFTIVIDPGHGGRDSGAVGFGVKEKDIALKIALEIGNYLEKDPGINVVYTRKKDNFIELYRRAGIANEVSADLFLSVHCDSFRRSDVRGTHAFVQGNHVTDRNYEVAKKENSVIFLEDGHQANYPGFDPSKPETIIALNLMQDDYLDLSIMAAKFIHDRVINDLNRKTRTVKQAGFLVLHQTFMPSVLLETGFLSNATDAKYLKSNKGQSNIAKAVANAVMDYRDYVQSNVSGSQHSAQIQELPNVEQSNKGSIYRIQIMASRKSLRPYDPTFKELTPITKESAGNLNRYYFGNTRNKQDALKLLREAKNRGFTQAVIVEFRDGKRIDPWR